MEKHALNLEPAEYLDKGAKLSDVLLQKIGSYDSDFDASLVKKAIDFAIKFHGSQSRESGDPYYLHPIEVGLIIADIKLDTTAIIAAILHDMIEDTDFTLEDMNNEFGPDVAKLVDGVTKLTKIEFQPDHVRQAENFRKLLLAMSDDIRVLLIKLADRLHNMRTIEYVKSPEKRMRIALETMEVFAPLAERIGMQQIKLELQDISFKILQPSIRESIISRLNNINSGNEELIKQVVSSLQETLKNFGVKAEFCGRQKSPYSIWMKMQQKNVSFEQLSDIIAFRVIVEDLKDCYLALGAIHGKYPMVPDSFQDFISTPKNNGYQSLHTVIIGPTQHRIEVQIRTKDMHEVAELGVAAHWIYKQKYKHLDGKQYRWLRELLSILDQAEDAEDFLQNTKLAMYYDQVFCFTPKGSLIALPNGSTPVDFAYAVHSDIGQHCVGAKVNGRIVPLRMVLKNGDQVEIITSKHQTPSPSWEKFVVTGKARSEIKKFLKSQQRQEYIKLGAAILERELTAKDIVLHKVSEEILNKFKKQSLDDLYFAIGEGSLSAEEVVKSISGSQKKRFSALAFLNLRRRKDPNPAIPIKGMIPGIAVHYASCCCPIPGDKIVGIFHTGKGLTVHTSDCEMLSNFSSTPERLTDISWDHDKSNAPFICKIKAMLFNKPGSMAVLCGEISKHKSNITNLKIVHRTHEFFDVIVDIEVAGVSHLNNIMDHLKAQELIYGIERFKV